MAPAQLPHWPFLQGDALHLNIRDPTDPVLIRRVRTLGSRVALGPSGEVVAQGVGTIREAVCLVNGFLRFAVQQLLSPHVERRRGLDKGVHPRQAPAALDEADLGSVEAGKRAEFFLRKPGATASHEQVSTEAPGGSLIYPSAVHQSSSSSLNSSAALVGMTRLVSMSSRPPRERSRTARR